MFFRVKGAMHLGSGSCDDCPKSHLQTYPQFVGSYLLHQHCSQPCKDLTIKVLIGSIAIVAFLCVIRKDDV